MLAVRSVHDSLPATELHAFANDTNKEVPLSTAQANTHPDSQSKMLSTVISSLLLLRFVKKYIEDFGDVQQAHVLRKSEKYCLKTSNGTEITTVSPTEKYCFVPRIGNTPTLTNSKRTQNRNTPFTTEARMVKQTHSNFLTGGPNAVVFVRRRKCVVGKWSCCDALTFV